MDLHRTHVLLSALACAAALTTTACSVAQPVNIDRTVGLAGLLSGEPLQEEAVLRSLGWDAQDTACHGKDCRADLEVSEVGLRTYRLREDDGLTVELSAFNDRVVELQAYRSYGLNPIELSIFDVEAYVEYAKVVLGPQPDSLLISAVDREPEVVRAYYELLGVDVVSEYGWICEYSTVGSPPAQRRAVIVLIDLHRRELLKNVLRFGPSWEGRIYAADALLYLDQAARARLEPGQPENTIGFYIHSLLSESDRLEVDKIRTSERTARTCENSGSYRIYSKPTNEVLSDSQVLALSEQYERLRQSGYFFY